MKRLIISFFLTLTILKITAQCVVCPTNNIFGDPNNYHLIKYTNTNKETTYNIDLSYEYLNKAPEIKLNTPQFEFISKQVKKVIILNYGKLFAAQCKITQIKLNPVVLHDTSNYNFYILLELTLKNNLKYKFSLDFSKTFFLLNPRFPTIKSEKLFGPNISCCKALNIAIKDVINPISNIASIILLHTPFVLENLETPNNTLVWLVEEANLNTGKKSQEKANNKYIDFFSGKIIKRSTNIAKVKVPEPLELPNMY